MAEPHEAKEVELRKVRPLAPSFHQHIARRRLMGSVCRVGQRVIVYEVARTDPSGVVCVTDNTILHFV